MALESQNWKREYLKSRAEVKDLKEKLKELRANSNSDGDLSELKNEIALLREDINSLREDVQSLTESVNQILIDDGGEDDSGTDDQYNMEDDPVFKQVRKILAKYLHVDEDEIETWTDVQIHRDDLIDELADYAGNSNYSAYRDCSDVSEIVNYINRYGDPEHSSLSTVVENLMGIHARPATVFVQTASNFRSKIQISAKGKTCDARSILMIMSMGLCKGTEITIRAEGPDARQAVSSLKELVDSKFGED